MTKNRATNRAGATRCFTFEKIRLEGARSLANHWQPMKDLFPDHMKSLYVGCNIICIPSNDPFFGLLAVKKAESNAASFEY